MPNKHKDHRELFANIAVAIRAKTGGTEAIKADAFPEAIAAIEVNNTGTPVDVDGWINDIDAGMFYVSHSWTRRGGYKHSELSKVKQSAFAKLSGLTKVSFPAARTVGSYAFMSCTDLSWASFLTCTRVEVSAFVSCINLKSVTFPALEYAGQGAFIEAGMDMIYLPITSMGDFVFGSMPNLFMANLPSIKSLGRYVFRYCPKLTTVNLPLCESTGYAAFDGCSAMSSIYLPVCKTLSAATFTDCTALHTASIPLLESIYQNAFQSCTALKSVSFPNCTTAEGAFAYCSNLESTYLPALKELSYYCFQYCEKLSDVTFHPDLSMIGHSAFQSCKALKSLTGYTKLRSIYDYAFYDCTSFSSITLASTGVMLGSNCFANTALTEFTHSGITSLNYGVFSSCKSLKKVDINKISSIEYGLFSDCNTIESIWMSSASTINQYCFCNCYQLSDLRLMTPLSGTDVPYQAFLNCSKLSVFPALGPTIKSIGSSAFHGCINMTTFEGQGITTVKPYAFAGTRLASASFPVLSELQSSVFAGVSTLSKVFFGQVTKIWSDALLGTAIFEITDAAFPRLNTLTSGCFRGMPELRFISLTHISSMFNEYPYGVANFVADCPKLEEIYINGTESQVTNNGWNTSAFYLCPAKKLTLAGIKGMKSGQLFANSLIEEITLPRCSVYSPQAFYSAHGLRRAGVDYGQPLLTSFTNQMFYNCYNLSMVSFPAVSKVTGASQFTDAGKLAGGITEWNVPLLQTIASYMFAGVSFKCQPAFDVVTSIGEHAFSKATCSILSFPNITNCNKIHQNAFRVAYYQQSHQTDVKEFHIPNATGAFHSSWFYGNSYVIKVVAPMATTITGNAAFYSCVKLTSVVMDAMTVIPNNTFASTALSVISFPNASRIGDYAFASIITSVNEINLPKITSLPSYTFYSTKGVIPSFSVPLVSMLGRSCLTANNPTGVIDKTNPTVLIFECPVTFPGVVDFAKVDKEAFGYQDYALSSNCYMSELAFPNAVGETPYNCFGKIAGLHTLRIPKATVINTCISGTNQTTSANTTLRTVECHDVTLIKPYAFAYCINLSTMIGFSKVTIISDYAFSCTAVTEFSLPVVVSMRTAFHRCSQLSKVTLPSTLTSMYRCFYSCPTLSTATLLMSTFIKRDGTFNGTPLMTPGGGSIYVPQSMIANYTNDTTQAGWNPQGKITANYIPIP